MLLQVEDDDNYKGADAGLPFYHQSSGKRMDAETFHQRLETGRRSKCSRQPLRNSEMFHSHTATVKTANIPMRCPTDMGHEYQLKAAV